MCVHPTPDEPLLVRTWITPPSWTLIRAHAARYPTRYIGATCAMKEPSVVSGWFRNLYTQINRNVQHQSPRNDSLQRSACMYLDVYHSLPDRYVKRPHSVKYQEAPPPNRSTDRNRHTVTRERGGQHGGTPCYTQHEVPRVSSGQAFTHLQGHPPSGGQRGQRRRRRPAPRRHVATQH